MTIKQALYQLCQTAIQQKIEQAQKGISDAQSSANNETKSSAGDKYETARAMMHLEKERFARQLAEAIQLNETLSNAQVLKSYETVQAGALVETSNGYFLIAASLGKLKHEGKTYFALSFASPIAQAIRGLKTGETGTFRGKKINIISIQ